MSNKVVISIGDPNSIGPEIVIKSLNGLEADGFSEVILFATSDLLRFYEENYGLKLKNNKVSVAEIDYKMQFEPGRETKESGEYSYLALEKAIEYCTKNNIKSLVTAPISKNAINLAGHSFQGQTEILQSHFCSERAQMLFAANDFRVLLLTRHIPLSEVSNTATKELITSEIRSANSALVKQLGVKSPKFALCALNPHAGENGLLGREENDFIFASVEELNSEGVAVEGPFPADSILAKGVQAYLKNEKQEFDCYIAFYHDQGLIPIKSVAKDETLNITIGLEILRTSPAHGTAFDIAGKNAANYSSMKNAISFFNKKSAL